MTRQELTAEFDRLRHGIRIIRESTGSAPDEIVALACQNMCVQICGSLEQSLKRIFVGYAKARSNDKIHRPIERVCETFQNPKSEKILELIGLFDDDFARELKRYWNEENETQKSHIDNLVDDRITIAHRKKNHFGVSTAKLDAYFVAYKSLLERIFEEFLGD